MVKKISEIVPPIPFANVIRRIPLEALLWLAGLIYLAAIDPTVVSKFSFCLFHNLGIEWCPGCGLGRSISYLLHGCLAESLKIHILGVAATVVIVLRISKLLAGTFTASISNNS
jgi:hypothetical protein